MKRAVLVCSFLVLGFAVSGQNEYNYWFFQGGRGLDFNHSPPAIFSHNSFTTEPVGVYSGFSSISDLEGNLLYYSNGHKLMDQRNNLITVLVPDSVSIVCPPLLIPIPNTFDEHIILYSKAEGSGNDGYASQLLYAKLSLEHSSYLEFKDSVLFEGNFSFIINGIRKNCDTTMVAISDFISNRTFVFTVTESGINPNFQQVEDLSVVKLSNNLSKSYFRDPINFHSDHIVWGIDINTLTQSNKIVLSCEDSLRLLLGESIISPDGSKFYSIEYDAVQIPSEAGTAYEVLHSYLFQYDLNAGDQQQIQASKKVVFDHSGDFLFQTQLGPDRKIYISDGGIDSGQSKLHVIRYPDEMAPACEFESSFLSIESDVNPIFQNYLHNVIAPKTDFQFSKTCTGVPVKFEGYGAESDGYLWNFGDPESGEDNFSTQKNPTHTYIKSGEYLVQMNPGCIQKKVTVVEPPNISLGADRTICAGESTLLEVEYSPTTNYSWSHSQLDTNRLLAVTEGYYWVEGSNTCALEKDSIYIERIEPVDGVDLKTIGSCYDDSIFFKVEFSVISDEPAVYEWHFNDGNIIATDSNSIFHRYNRPKDYLPYVVLSYNGCNLGSDTVSLQIEDRPNPDLGSDLEICYFQEVVLDAGDYQSPVNYEWSNGETTREIVPNRTGVYTVTVHNNCDSVSDSLYIDIIPEIIATIPDDTVVCDGSFTVLDAGNNHAEINYIWQDGSGSQYYETQQPGRYWVDVFSRCNAVRDYVNLYFINEEFGLAAPNVITPNGDGLNDYFEVLALDNPDFRLIVYDRWGKVLYESLDPFVYWDGTNNGKFVPAGTYYWSVNGRDCYNEPKVFKGFVSVLKGNP